MNDNVREYDVLVCGGGTAGVIAAIQAARAGAKTLLVEYGSQLGGTMTTGMVSFPGLFHAYGQQIIKGIGWELVSETVGMNGDELQDFTVPYPKHQHPRHQINLNPYLYAILAEEKCIQAGVEIRYYESPTSAVFSDGKWAVEVAGKGTSTTFICKQLVDCTGNALLAQIAGFRVIRSKVRQPGSVMFKLAGYDVEQLDVPYIQSEYEKALLEGVLKREEYFDRIIDILRTGYYKNKSNTFINHIHGADSTTSETHTVTNIYGRNTVLRLLRFLKKLKGLEHVTIHSMAPETSVRETGRIEGEHRVVINEYVTGQRYKDGVCNAFYPVDIHDENGVKPVRLKDKVVPSIPLGALIPKGSDNFVVAGRCLSSDRMANSALRVEAPCMAMGQVAGAVAALGAKLDLTPREIPIGGIHKLLEAHEAILPSS